MTTSFDNTRLPVDVEQGAVGGPSFGTTIIALGSGQEVRNENWSKARHSWDIGYGIQYLRDLEAVRSFFYARRGRSRAFLFKDWQDYRATDTVIPTGGVTGNCQVPLSKRYGAGEFAFDRAITRPNTDKGPITLKVNGAPYLGMTTCVYGLMTLLALPAGVLTASYEFDVPVRFDTDDLHITQESIETGQVDSIPVKEILENAWLLNGLPIP